MKVLILGASGATGKLVVNQLLKRQIDTRVIIRANAALPEDILNNPLLEIIRGNITDFDSLELIKLLADCDAVVSCLGHNLTVKGIFGKPRTLVFSAIKNVVETVVETVEAKINNPVKIILMSTTGYTNTEAGEKNSSGERFVLSMLKVLLPPHLDNMLAADYLTRNTGKRKIEWIAVRPDTLINENTESAYDVYDSHIRSPIFNAGKTSRINVSHFIAELLTDKELWQKWKYKMPVIYNTENSMSATEPFRGSS